MRKMMLTMCCLFAFAVPAQASQNYSLDQVAMGVRGWINTFYPDIPADGFNRSGNFSCSWEGTPHEYGCSIDIIWRNDLGTIVARDSIGLLEKVRIKGKCGHKLYYMARKHQWRARVRIPVRYAANRGCILFRADSPQFASRQDHQ